MLIYGSGTMGLMMLELAKRTGAASVDILDINPERLATAPQAGLFALRRLGADELETARAAGTSSSTPPATRRPSRTASAGSPRAARSCSSGSPTTRRPRSIEPYRIYNQEITITGSMAVLHSYERAAALFATGVLDPAVFISDRLPLSSYPQAIERFASGVGRKIVVVP